MSAGPEKSSFGSCNWKCNQTLSGSRSLRRLVAPTSLPQRISVSHANDPFVRVLTLHEDEYRGNYDFCVVDCLTVLSVLALQIWI